MGSPDNKTILTIRAPRDLAEQVRELARREGEADSIILRRLIRRGLEAVALESR